MDVRDRTDRRLISTLLLVGAALALFSNALHPFFAADATAAEVISEAGSSALWVPIHLAVVVAVVLLTAAVVQIARWFRDTAAAPLANLAVLGAVVGATMFTVQVGAIDGYVFPLLAETGAGGSEAAAALYALDGGILSLVVLLYFGATFLLFGMAMDRADAFAPWIRWTAMGSGVVGLLVGLLMFLDVAGTFTFIAFRIVALGVTVVAIGVGLELRRAPAGAGATAPAGG